MIIRISKLHDLNKTTYLSSALKYELYKQLISRLGNGRYDYMETYIKKELDVNLGLSKILKLSISNLKTLQDDEYFMWYLPDYITIPSTNYKLSDIINLIDKGNMYIKGTCIVRNSIEYVEANLIRKIVKQLW